jgi:hypothetical protein
VSLAMGNNCDSRPLQRQSVQFPYQSSTLKGDASAPGRASRRASFAQPGRARLVQVERPTGRTTWTRRARSGCLRCATGRGSGPGIPESPGSRGGAPAAGGIVRVVGPEALPAGGTSVATNSQRSNVWHSRDP